MNVQRLNIVLISRADTEHRKLLNEAALEDLLIELNICQVQQAVSALRRRGTAAKCTQLLTVWCWQGLTIPQTVQIFQQARIVLAPHGAGLANTIFCGYVLVCCSMR